MKFARYLEDTQTPEWKKAYVDYRLLKKRITAIRRANETQDSVESPGSTQTNLGITSEASAGPSAPAPNVSHATISRASTKNSSSHALIKSQTNLSAPDPVVNTDPYRREPLYRAQTLPTSVHSSSKSNRAPSFSRLFSSSGSKSKISARRFTAGLKPHPYSELPLGELMPLLSPVELAFFTTLDAELEKIEAFYLAREKEMRVHTELLEQQLDELQEHRKLFEAAHAHTSWRVDLCDEHRRPRQVESKGSTRRRSR
ncbi:SPX domain-containing protein [Mycena metata]|uniref:SPX domain-containing protein n=1 Tax=Mycena metata TaxID=1033252 RepID=A0AAD7K797_9AGAR|nr:SPX domain-containing protein [Mycena metata]